KDDAVQLADRSRPAGPRLVRARRTQHRGTEAGQGGRARRGAHLPEHPPIRQPVRARERHDRKARPHARRRARRRAPRSGDARGGGPGAGRGGPATRGEEASIERRAAELLDYVGLRARANEAAGNLPYGDQRRLEIARALATDPLLLALDEPAAGMNASEAA